MGLFLMVQADHFHFKYGIVPVAGKYNQFSIANFIREGKKTNSLWELGHGCPF